ncbi:MAG: radical SAM protein [Bdellovibrionaceae bacterium]|nr:radical SAM protein [Bdellovibrionales bacterium]MCB9253398.1 radical SAM protein [Pseudobdellovibrionaceae bacterium]
MFPAALKINEIFYSLQGESLSVGKPTVFVRVATCNMRCSWCDTRYAFWEGHRMTVEEILQEVGRYPTKFVCVTGGEPLGQQASLLLMQRLLEQGYTVSLETGGGFSVASVPDEVIKVIDVKCPDSGETESMCWDNLQLAGPRDQFKFVVASKVDFDWATGLIRKERLTERAAVLFSPVEDRVPADSLAAWVLESGLPVTFQLQLHKKIWGKDARGV